MPRRRSSRWSHCEYPHDSLRSSLKLFVVGAILAKDQAETYERCAGLMGLDEDNDGGWTTIKSDHPGILMWMKNHSIPGERTVATGKATAIIDSNAEEVAGWLMDFNSNERVRVNKKAGHPARLTWRHPEHLNEIGCASVKSMPLPLKKREFVARQFWKFDGEEVKIVVESIPLKIDYGTGFSMIRGSTR